MHRVRAVFGLVSAGVLIGIMSAAATSRQAASPVQPQTACAAAPSAPGCSDLASMSRALGDLLTTCTEQADAGVCPYVVGSDVRPPASLLEPGNLQPLVPSDHLWIWDAVSENWFGISQDVSETCRSEPETVGCSAVDDVLESAGRFQSVCRQESSSPACGAFAADRGAELTGGTPTTTAGRQPLTVPWTTIDSTGGRPPVIPVIPGSGRTIAPFIFSTIDPSHVPGGRPAPPLTTPSVPGINLVESADTFQVSPGGLNPAVQLMVIDNILEQLQSSQREVEPLRLFRALSGPRAVLASWSPPARAPSWSAPAPQDRPVQIFLTSLGTSTGEAFELRAFNTGGTAVQLRAEGLVIQPLNADMTRRVQQELQRQTRRGGGSVTARLDAYCMEFLRQPPAQGMMFQVAGAGLQQKFAPVRSILEASRLVRQAGGLSPDSAPEAYFHSIRQWAIWTREQGFTVQTFTDAFVAHTRKNFAQAGGRWTDAVEGVVRGAAPNRWNDIQKILQRADGR